MVESASKISVIIADDEVPARAKLQRWLEEQADIQLVAQAADGLEALDQIALHKPQLVFLDIQMPGVSGLEVAAQLDEANAPLVIFVTAHDEHALKAFELDAVDYLLKPYDKERFLRTLQRARERLASNQPATAPQSARRLLKRLLVPQGDKLQLIATDDIIWLEAEDNYVRVHTHNQPYLMRTSLQDLLLQLGDSFLRIHKSCAVNLLEIASLDPLFKGDYELKLRNGQSLRLSRRYKDNVFARLES